MSCKIKDNNQLWKRQTYIRQNPTIKGTNFHFNQSTQTFLSNKYRESLKYKFSIELRPEIISDWLLKNDIFQVAVPLSNLFSLREIPTELHAKLAKKKIVHDIIGKRICVKGTGNVDIFIYMILWYY